MKHEIIPIMAAVMWGLSLFALPAQAQYGGGSGMADDPYLIYTAEHLNAIGANPGDLDRHFKLMADIDLAGFTGTSFNIIGELYYDAGWVLNPFTGVFDGNGHTISNFTYTSTEGDNIGIFGYFDSSGEIKDLGLIDPNVDAGTADYVGSLVGRVSGGAITGCYIEGGSVSGNYYVGGLVGSNYGSITNCCSTASVSGNGCVGGLLGWNNAQIIDCNSTGSVSGQYCVGGLCGSNTFGTISNCDSEADVSGGFDVGGLVGENEDGTITNCCATGSVTGNYTVGGLVGTNQGPITNCYSAGEVNGYGAVGGLVGYGYRGTITNCCSTVSVSGVHDVGGLVGDNRGTITNCYETGSVKGNNDVGGLVGRNSYGCTITNCYATGSVSGDGTVGGLVGYNYLSSILNCYSTGSVSGEWYVGGLVGRNSRGEVTNSFWDIETSGQTSSSRGIGLPTDEMQTMSTFTDAGWDFVGESVNGEEDIWKIFEGLSYPHLSWEPPIFLYTGPDQFFVNVIPPKVILDASSLGNQLSYQWRQVAGPSVILEGADEPIVSFIPTEFGVYVFELTVSDGQAEGTDMVTVYIEERYAGGTGTAQNPCQIRTAEQMNEIGLHPEDWSRHFKLMADIDLSCFDGKDGSPEFNIIGEYVGYNDPKNNPFTGVFDGNGRTISNFIYTSIDTDYIGLFGYVRGENAEIKNLGLIDAEVDAGTGDYVGSLVGCLNKGTITNCYVEGGRVLGSEYVGGMVGSIYGGTITNCYFTGEVIGGEVCAGGLVGSNGEGTITNSYSTASVSGTGWFVGGLVGDNSGTISNCYSEGSVAGDSYIGGLLGTNYYYYYGPFIIGTITNCYSTDSVSGNRYVDGLVGENYEGTITNSYSTASVSGDYYVGGLVGFGGRITNCYATGSVEGNEAVGGLVGYGYIVWPSGQTTVFNSFWDIETSGQVTSAGGTGLPTAEMQMMSTFTDSGWDFVGETFNGIEDIWFIPEGDYPHLWWEGMQVPMKLTPRTLNCRSYGKWVKAHITLPEGFTVADVDPDRPAVLHSFGFQSAPLYVFVNKDKLVEVEAPFEREAVCSLAGDWPEVLTVAGLLTDGRIFLGRSTVRIIHPGLKVIEELANCWLQGDCVHPTWCDGIDMNRDSLVTLLDYALLMNIEVEFVSE
ncbi:MAG: GLUG motif-containing protein [Sedimentisphaerales bacterium]